MLPTTLDLDAPQDWRPAPMPGANLPLDLVRLASPRARFTIHGRFPLGFERLTPGGYQAAEEFLVLEGELELEGRTYTRGDLTVVPPGYRRTEMRSPGGCRVLAWFSGLPDFVGHDRLTPGPDPVVSAAVHTGAALPSSPGGYWGCGEVPAGTGAVDVISAALDRWSRFEQAEPPLGPTDLVRRERP